MTLMDAGRSVMPVRGSTKVVGVFGHPVAHSLSPAMHNAAFAALRLPYIYVPFPVAPDEIGSAVRSLLSLGIVGVNLTIPHKESVLPFLDELTDAAREVGAVNTVHCMDGRLLGDNTDGRGFYEPLREQGFEVAGRSVVILGAGGAARSVAFRLAHEGACIVLANRTPDRAIRLAHSIATARPDVPALKVIALEDEPMVKQAVAAADLLVNTTRVGMVPDHQVPPPVPTEALHSNLLVYDLVYNPVETSLLRQARLQGCRILTGVKMLVYQGAAAFERWTGIWPPTDIMEAAVLEGLKAVEPKDEES